MYEWTFIEAGDIPRARPYATLAPGSGDVHCPLEVMKGAPLKQGTPDSLVLMSGNRRSRIFFLGFT
jgi:hypothetical protein